MTRIAAWQSQGPLSSSGNPPQLSALSGVSLSLTRFDPTSKPENGIHCGMMEMRGLLHLSFLHTWRDYITQDPLGSEIT